MQGIVTDEKGAYVKAAIVALFRETETSGETEEGAVTYDETDEKGRFLIQELNPDDKYIIEVFVPRPEPAIKAAEVQWAEKEPEQTVKFDAEEDYEPEPATAAEPVWDNMTGSQDFFDVLDELESGEEDELPDVYDLLNEADIIDSLAMQKHSSKQGSYSISCKNLYDMSGIKEKQYLTKINLW